MHHIIPFREFDGDWKSANKLSNLVSLCEYPCHRKRHSKKN
ncbi:HNH endonuclease [Bacillus timonensis]